MESNQDWKPTVGKPAWCFNLEVTMRGVNHTVLREGIVTELREPDLVFLEDPTEEESFDAQYLSTVYETAESAINNLPCRYLGGNQQKIKWIDED